MIIVTIVNKWRVTDDSSFVRKLLNSGWLVLVFHLKAFYFIRHGAFILRVLLRVSQYLGRRLSIVCVFSLRWFLFHGLDPLAVLSSFICLIGELGLADLSWLPPSITAFIPLWIFPTSFSGLSAGAFCIQTGSMGCRMCLFLTITHVDLFIPGRCRFRFNWLKCHHRRFYVPWCGR